jgi:hypothetical protein
MKNYYYYILNKEKKGPYHINEIKDHTIFYDTLVWSKDSNEWKKASEYLELLELLYSNPEKPQNLDQSKIIHFAMFIYKRYVLFSFGLSLLHSFLLMYCYVKLDSIVLKSKTVDFWFRAYKDIFYLLTDSNVYISYFESKTPIINITGKMLLSTYASNIPVFFVYGLILYIYQTKFKNN